MASPEGALRDRAPMSWWQYWALAESVRGEYVDGQLIMTPGPDRVYRRACRRLAAALETALPAGYEVDEGWNWTPVIGVNFIPDVMVYPATADLIRYTGTPVLAVEVLSENRSHDIILKRSMYASFALPNLWMVDREAGTLTVLKLVGGAYRDVATVRDIATEIDFDIARITLSVPDLLA